MYYLYHFYSNAMMTEYSAKKYSDQLSVIKYDVEGCNNKDLKVELLLQGLIISGLPTLVIYHEGKPLKTHSGMITEEGLDERLHEHLFSKMNDFNTTNNETEPKEREHPVKENEFTPIKKRGFVSLASSERDDYML